MKPNRQIQTLLAAMLTLGFGCTTSPGRTINSDVMRRLKLDRQLTANECATLLGKPTSRTPGYDGESNLTYQLRVDDRGTDYRGREPLYAGNTPATRFQPGNRASLYVGVGWYADGKLHSVTACQGNKMDDSKLPLLKEGMTKSQIEVVFGLPDCVIYGQEGESFWSYFYNAPLGGSGQSASPPGAPSASDRRPYRSASCQYNGEGPQQAAVLLGPF